MNSSVTEIPLDLSPFKTKGKIALHFQNTIRGTYLGWSVDGVEQHTIQLGKLMDINHQLPAGIFLMIALGDHQLTTVLVLCEQRGVKTDVRIYIDEENELRNPTGAQFGFTGEIVTLTTFTREEVARMLDRQQAA